MGDIETTVTSPFLYPIQQSVSVDTTAIMMTSNTYFGKRTIRTVYVTVCSHLHWPMTSALTSPYESSVWCSHEAYGGGLVAKIWKA